MLITLYIEKLVSSGKRLRGVLYNKGLLSQKTILLDTITRSSHMSYSKLLFIGLE